MHAGLDRERQRRVGGLGDVVALGQAEHLVGGCHHDPGETPLGAQHLLQQPGVGVQGDAVVRDGGGQHEGRARAHRGLAGGQHGRPERPLRPAVVDAAHRLPGRTPTSGRPRPACRCRVASGRRPAGRRRGHAPARRRARGRCRGCSPRRPMRPGSAQEPRTGPRWRASRRPRAPRGGRGHLGDQVGVPGGRPGERGRQRGQVGRVVQRHGERRDRAVRRRPDAVLGLREVRAIAVSGRARPATTPGAGPSTGRGTPLGPSTAPVS